MRHARFRVPTIFLLVSAALAGFVPGPTALAGEGGDTAFGTFGPEGGSLFVTASDGSPRRGGVLMPPGAQADQFDLFIELFSGQDAGCIGDLVCLDVLFSPEGAYPDPQNPIVVVLKGKDTRANPPDDDGALQGYSFFKDDTRLRKCSSPDVAEPAPACVKRVRVREVNGGRIVRVRINATSVDPKYRMAR